MENRIKYIILIFLFFAHPAFALQKITLQLQWKHQFEYAGFYMAKEKGYYRDVGLDVDFVEFNPNINLIDKVLNTKNMYGTTYANIVSDYLEGKPIVFVANFFKQSPLAIVTTPEIKRPLDLKGKRIMGVSKDINSAIMLIMFKKFNIKSKDFIHVPTTFNIEDFKNKKVDAMAIFTTNEIFYLNKEKVPYNLLNPTVYGAEFYDLNLFTSKMEVMQHPKRVENFKNASIKGWDYALKHKQEAVDLILKQYNTQHKSREALMFEANQIENIMLPNVYPIGSIDKNRIKLMADDFKNLGLVKKNKTINYEDFIFKEHHYYIKLTNEELAFLKTKSVIKVHNEMNWAPFNYNKNGKAEGFSIDYMNLIAKKIGIKVQYIHGYNWNEFMEMIKNGKIDVMLNIAITPKREEFLSFTTSYKKIIDSIVTKKENIKKYKKLSDFNGKVLAIVKGFYEEELIKKYYPNIKILEVDTTLDGLKAVVFNEADGIVNSLGVLNYTMAKYDISNLALAFDINGIGNKKFNIKLHIATNKNQKILRDIIQKGLNQITEDEKNSLMNKWFLNKTPAMDYKLVVKSIFIIFIIIVFIIIWNIRLKKTVRKEIEKNKTQESLLLYYNKQESMKNVVTNIAHQWKHPLNELSSKIMFLDSKLFLNHKISNQELKNITNSVKTSVQFMTSTIDTFNDFYKKDTKREYFNIEEAVNGTLYIIQNFIEKHKIIIKKDIDEDLYIVANKNQLQQVILTFISNAQKIFWDRAIENPKIEIRAYKRDNKIIIIVEDNGGGIDGSFEDIFKVTVSKTTNSSGFGLFIAKNIIENKFFGVIKATNTTEGALFKVEIPIDIV